MALRNSTLGSRIDPSPSLQPTKKRRIDGERKKRKKRLSNYRLDPSHPTPPFGDSLDPEGHLETGDNRPYQNIKSVHAAFVRLSVTTSPLFFFFFFWCTRHLSRIRKGKETCRRGGESRGWNQRGAYGNVADALSSVDVICLL